MASSELSPVHIEGLPSPDPTPGGFYSESERDESNFYIDPDVVDEADDDYVTIEELSQLSGYTIRQLYRLAEEGRVRSEQRLAPITQQRKKLFISVSSFKDYSPSKGIYSSKLKGE